MTMNLNLLQSWQTEAHFTKRPVTLALAWIGNCPSGTLKDPESRSAEPG